VSPSQQLPFSAGDMIVTYGSLRPDGFYHGKVRGKHGLVPASFMEEVALLRSRGRRSAGSGSSVASPASFFSPPQSIAESDCRPQSRGSHRGSHQSLPGSRPGSTGSRTSKLSGSRPGSSQSLHNGSPQINNTHRI